MIVVDASCLVEVLIGTRDAEPIRERLRGEPDHAAPHVVDVEVMGVLRREHLRGAIDQTASTQAIADLRDWPGERFGHRLLLDRAWALRATLRGWDAFYVALAEALDSPLLTRDRRLAFAVGPRCQIELI